MKKIFSILLSAVAFVAFNSSAVTFTIKFSNPDAITLATKDIGSKATATDLGQGAYQLSCSSSWGNTVIFKYSNGSAYTSEDIKVINQVTSEPLASSGQTWQINSGNAFNVTVGSGWEDGATYLVSTPDDDDTADFVILKFSDPSVVEKVTEGSTSSVISLTPDENGEIKFNINLATTAAIYLQEGYTIESVEDKTSDTILKEGTNWAITDNVISFYLNYSMNYGSPRVNVGDVILFTTKASENEDDETTGIKNIELTNRSLEIYDLQGRKLNSIEQSQGILIVNGKKVVR